MRPTCSWQSRGVVVGSCPAQGHPGGGVQGQRRREKGESPFHQQLIPKCWQCPDPRDPVPLPGRVAAGLATLTVHRTLPGAPVPRPEGAACRRGRVPQMPGVVATEDTAPPSGWAVACGCMGLVALEGSAGVGGAGAPRSSAASDGSMPGGGESPSTCFSRANLGARGRLHSMTHSLLTDCSSSAWWKNQLFFTRHEARASDAVYAKTFWFRKKEKLPLQKNTKKQNKKNPPSNRKVSQGPGQTL